MESYMGKWAGNAETEINYVNKKVSFNYPHNYINENFAYFTHNFYIVIGMIFGYIIGIIICRWLVQSSNYWIYIDSYLILCIALLFIFSYMIGGLVLFGYISLLIHKISPVARKSFSKTNAIFSCLKRKKKIDLSEKYSKKHYIDGNKLILFNYDICFFEFEYDGNNKLLKFNTKSVEKGKHKGMHYKFIAIFTFKNKLDGGILTYK